MVLEGVDKGRFDPSPLHGLDDLMPHLFHVNIRIFTDV
jgi:hypothetical protein